MIDLWYPGYVAFESTEKAAYYLRQKGGHLILDRYDATNDFKEDASFLLRKKNSDGKSVAGNVLEPFALTSFMGMLKRQSIKRHSCTIVIRRNDDFYNFISKDGLVILLRNGGPSFGKGKWLINFGATNNARSLLDKQMR